MVGLVSFPLDKIAVNPSLPHLDKEKRIGPHGPIPELLPQSTWHPASSQTPLQDGAARAKSLAARMGLQGWGCMGRFATMAMRFWRNMHILRQTKGGKGLYSAFCMALNLAWETGRGRESILISWGCFSQGLCSCTGLLAEQKALLQLLFSFPKAVPAPSSHTQTPLLSVWTWDNFSTVPAQPKQGDATPNQSFQILLLSLSCSPALNCKILMKKSHPKINIK